jgi:hypothetical protein
MKRFELLVAAAALGAGQSQEDFSDGEATIVSMKTLDRKTRQGDGQCGKHSRYQCLANRL